MYELSEKKLERKRMKKDLGNRTRLKTRKKRQGYERSGATHPEVDNNNKNIIKLTIK